MGPVGPDPFMGWYKSEDMARRVMGLGSWQFVLIVFSQLAWTAWAQQKEITDEQLKLINTANDLDLKKAFRCGLFFPPELEGQLPIAPLFIFNASFPADECPTDDSERFIGFCHSIWKKILKYIVYTNPSLKKDRAAKGVTLGDDICGVVKNKVKAPFVGKKSRKFPKGLQIGMYTNSCGSDAWLDTQDRHPQRICCSKGKLADCP